MLPDTIANEDKLQYQLISTQIENAAMRRQILILGIKSKYHLKDGDTFDPTTGVITRLATTSVEDKPSEPKEGA